LFLVDSLMREGEFLVDLCKVLHVTMLFVLLVSFPTVFLASFPDVIFTVWFCTEWFRGNFPNVLITVLYTDLFNVFHVESASVLHWELIWA
jgi:amino acid permease